MPRIPCPPWLAAVILSPLLTQPLLAQTAAQRTFAPVSLQVPGGQRQTLYDASYALVIGASKYTNGWSSLPGVPGDVKAVSALLTRQGFQVTEVLDPTRDQLDQALSNFVAQRGLREGNRLMVYFAGHGHTLQAGPRKLGYIVPVDAPDPNRDPVGFRQKAYSMEFIEVHARQIEARHALFVFDSCFSGTIFRTRSAVPDAITDRTAKPVRQFITAGDENQVVPDESIFRRQLERGLGEGDADLNRDGYITGTELGDFLQDQVTNYSRRAQTPRHGKIRDPDLDRGDFVFLAPASRLASAAPIGVGSVVKDCAECPELVVLPAGRFQMGSPEGEAGRDKDEGPVREVVIAYRLAVGRNEVSRSEFGRFVSASGYKTEAERAGGCAQWDGKEWKYDGSRNWRSPGFEQGEDHPVVCVSWNDAQAYVKWLNEKAPGRGYRLLSEAEWEYAARAGTTTRYPWGDDLQASAQCVHANGADETAKSLVPGASGWTVAGCRDGHAYTAPALSLRPNAYGLHHMHGNALEWVTDVWHDDYAGAPRDGSAWTAGGDQARRVLRGGSWGNSPQYLRSAFRSWSTPANRDYSIGFRIARTF